MGNLLKGPWGENQANSVSQDDSNEYVVIDTETTGLFKKDRIVEIACVVFKNGKMLE